MKKSNLSTLLTLSVLLGSALVGNSQDPQFSQYYATPMYTNPAFAGSGCNRLSLAYRIQYYGLPGGFVTFNLAYDQPVKKIHGGVGLMYTNDKAAEGILTSNAVNLSYAFEAKLGKKLCLRLGAQAGVFQRTLQWDRLRWGSDIITQLGYATPTNYTSIDKSVTGVNFGAGALIYSNKFYAGFACHNITEPSQSFFGGTGEGTYLPRRYTVHGGFLIPLDKREDPKWTISPNILLMAQAKFNQANIGFYIYHGAFVAGFWFRQTTPNADAVIGSIGFRKGRVKIGFSNDVTISSLKSAGRTAQELTLAFQLNRKKSPCTPEPKCPIF
jgi:type IX secretion system PorP/SprF family membrane protein